MKHKNKILFLAITLATVLILTTAVNATNTTDHNTDHTLSKKTSTPANSEIKETTTNKEKITSNKKMEEKTIQKENKTDKEKKSDSITIDGVTYTIKKDSDVINGFEFDNMYYDNCTFKERGTLIIGNGYLNNSYIDNVYFTALDSPLTLQNTILNSSSVSSTKLIIKENVILIGDCTLDYRELECEDLNFIINYMPTLNGDYTFENVSIQNNKINNGNLTISNHSLLNATITNNGKLTITDDTTFGDNFVIYNYGELIINNTDRLTPYLGIYEGNINLANMVISSDKINNGNLTFTQCNISAKITNNGNLTLINCSLSNNNMTTTYSKTDGFILENNGNTSLINCHVENNTFTSNITYSSGQYYTVYGAIYNNGLMNIINTTLSNNILQAYEDSFRLESYGVCITNNETLNIFDSIFEKNQLNTRGGGAIFNHENASLNVNNTTFQGNQGGERGNGSSIFIAQKNIGETGIFNASYNITNSKFNNNSAQTGGAIFIDDLLNDIPTLQIENCVFTNNTARVGGAIRIIKCDAIIKSCIFDKNNGNGILKCGKDSVYDFYSRSNVEIDNCTFTNNYGNDILYTEHNTNVTNSLFENNTGNPSGTNSSIVHIRGTSNYINNTFKNNSESNYLLYDNIGLSKYEWGTWGEQTTIFSHLNNETIINNTFQDNKVTIGTIFSLEPDNITKQENKYINTSIDDTLTLNIPNKIYTGEAITITGTYNINNPQDYDEDILEENQFQLYINGELKQTQDTINFTITPTTGTMILTIQPTISQTRKTEAIRATTLTNIIITPENYNEYIYEGKLIGVGKDSKILFAGTFTDKNEISIDTQDIVIDGSNATFTNTIFKLEATGITLQNMNINNTQTEYPIQNTKDNNIITGNTITITNTEGKTAAIYNKASNTEISYNTIYVDGPALSIDHGITSAANTQAILLIGGDKNIIEYNNIEATSTQTSEIFGTVEAITNYQEATNTIIRNNNIKVTGNAKFNYGINSLKNVQNITITNNNILVTGERYADGIQVGNNAENILIQDNTIKCICQNTTPVDEEAITYGIVTTNMGSGASNNVTIKNNNIDLTGSVNYGIEVYQTTNTLITDNIINVNGLQSMGIGYSHSPNSTITGKCDKQFSFPL